MHHQAGEACEKGEFEMTAADPFDLERFVTAQAPVFETMLAELRAGRKRSHWMWFVFPQLAGLGRFSRARFYGISSVDEARAYLAHPVLGPRLDLCTRTVLASGAEGPAVSRHQRLNRARGNIGAVCNAFIRAQIPVRRIAADHRFWR
jgi:hypothetical protein